MNYVACYVRVSTVGQNEAGQKREILRWLEGNGIDSSKVRWYLDKETGDDLDPENSYAEPFFEAADDPARQIYGTTLKIETVRWVKFRTWVHQTVTVTAQYCSADADESELALDPCQTYDLANLPVTAQALGERRPLLITPEDAPEEWRAVLAQRSWPALLLLLRWRLLALPSDEFSQALAAGLDRAAAEFTGGDGHSRIHIRNQANPQHMFYSARNQLTGKSGDR